ncbi:hypothetical protein LPB72_15410 [Hydrogenophaga crassostreae]|uniref:TonB C-terminal domain-containing protein n=1 Tax=Hydrogenophaga crassostreae TaxID=1763535 RepID=A0A167HBT8_9BURK|nr:energy transducer TonB [Hydrogenophaga crassostreae]AOW15711.1 hypothetical protein LPB072_15825 [Hydrogenophaga crassostreae]OAD40680.1 hypothetical protein LPB72_15410 [Hydrogenophaga crassostreae]
MPPRLLPIALTVVCAHGLALWALQGGLMRPAKVPAETVIMVADWIEAPQPEIPPAPPAPPAPPKAEKPPAPKLQAPTPLAPQRVREPAPQPIPPVAEVAPAPAPPPLSAGSASESAANAITATAAPSAPPAPPAPPKVELPSSSASYLNNAPPRYPAISRRMGEQGRVVVRALIEANGTASQASIQTSSGYERLDQTALKTVQSWRYVPGKRGGVPEAMWFNIPLNFVLD